MMDYIGIRLPKGHKDILRTIAAQSGSSVSRIVNNLITREVSKYRKALEPEKHYGALLQWMELKGIIGPQGKYAVGEVFQLFSDNGLMLIETPHEDIPKVLERLASDKKADEIVQELNAKT